MPATAQKLLTTHNIIFVLLLATLPAIAVLSPRSMAFVPGLIGVIGFFSTWRIQGTRPQILKIPLYIALGTLALAGLSSLWAIDPEFALERTQKMALVLMPGVVFLSFLKAQSREFCALFCKALPIGIFVGIAMNWVELNFQGLIYNQLRDLDPNTEFNLSVLNRGVVTTTLCIFVGLAALKLAKFNEFHSKLITGIFVYSFVLMLFITHSQSAHLAFLFGLIIFAFFPARVNIAWKALGTLCIALIASTPFLVQFLYQTFPPLVDQMSWFQNSYAANRMEIWDFVSRYAMQNPFYGFGIEATRVIEDFDVAMTYHEDTTVLHPHNFAVQVWIEFGVLGAIALSAFIAAMFWIIQRQDTKTSKLWLATFIAFLSVASTGYGLWQSWWLGTMFLGAGYCLILGKVQGEEKTTT